MSTNSTTSIDFSVIFEDRPLKYVGVISSVVLITIFVPLCLGIIWFERFGSDLRRILINRLVSCICWCLLEGLIVFWLADVILYFYRPFPVWICYLQVIYRQSILLRIVLLFDAMTISRYVFIFWLKNPLNFDDEFWCCFINASISSLSILNQTIYVILPGRQPLQFYLCSDMATLDIEQFPHKKNGMLWLVLCISLIIHIYVPLRIALFKAKTNSVHPLGQSNPYGFFTMVEKQSLSNFVTNVFGLMSLLVVIFGFAIGINQQVPSFYSQSSNYLFVYYLHFIFPLLIIGPIIFMFYHQNSTMRKTIYREIKNQFKYMKDCVLQLFPQPNNIEEFEMT